MKQHIIFLFLLIVTFYSGKINGQVLITKSDSVSLGQDSIVKLRVQEYRGNIQWQKSPDGVYWNNMTGKIADTLTIIPDTEAMYRALITGGSCIPVFSDTASIVFNKPVITTNFITGVTQTTATGGGNVTSDGGATIFAKGVCWNTIGNPNLTDSVTNDGTGTGSFTSNLTGLTANTPYYVKAYATNSKGTAYGSQIPFTTSPEIALPAITTNSITGITQTTATGGGNVTSDGGATIFAKGVCWNTIGNPNITDSKTNDGTGTGSFTSNLTGLTANTPYYVRAYATNSKGTAYGSQIPFTTSPEIALPAITTNSITGISQTTATGGGNVTSDGGATVSAKGVCWNTIGNPNITDSKTNDGTGTGSFTSNLTGLTANTPYYVRAYATNSKGTAYGSQIPFTTSPEIVLPAITTRSITGITQTTATGGGNVTSDGGATISAKGVCWNTTGNPLITDNKTNDGTGTGSFTSNLTGLTANTPYYVRAYATNSKGTAYGSQVSFTTSPEIVLPAITTNSITGITQTTASGGGNVTSDGGATVSAKGVCWNTTGNPSITDRKTTDGTGTGSFTSNLTGLTANTPYYVRAYATNSKGTAYGISVPFTTSPEIALPAITTNPITGITQTTATGGGNVTSDGGATISAKGVCWNTTGNPNITDSKTTDGTGTGSFTSNLTGLTANTLYYVRAYATNSKGTAYGITVPFTTSPEIALPAITTNPITGITQTTASGGGDITSDGGAAVTAKGVCWNTTGNPGITDSKTTDGTSTGSFISNLTGLTANTPYYVRAYATNSKGTAYGNQVSFTTLASVNYSVYIYGSNYCGYTTALRKACTDAKIVFTYFSMDNSVQYQIEMWQIVDEFSLGSAGSVNLPVVKVVVGVKVYGLERPSVDEIKKLISG